MNIEKILQLKILFLEPLFFLPQKPMNKKHSTEITTLFHLRVRLLHYSYRIFLKIFIAGKGNIY